MRQQPYNLKSGGPPPGSECVLGHSARAGLPAYALVIDVAPEVAVVLSVGDGDLFAGVAQMRRRGAEIQFLCVDVEPIDVIEQAVCVVDDAAHRGYVAVARLQ